DTEDDARLVRLAAGALALHRERPEERHFHDQTFGIVGGEHDGASLEAPGDLDLLEHGEVDLLAALDKRRDRALDPLAQAVERDVAGDEREGAGRAYVVEAGRDVDARGRGRMAAAQGGGEERGKEGRATHGAVIVVAIARLWRWASSRTGSMN